MNTSYHFQALKNGAGDIEYKTGRPVDSSSDICIFTIRSDAHPKDSEILSSAKRALTEFESRPVKAKPDPMLSKICDLSREYRHQ